MNGTNTQGGDVSVPEPFRGLTPANARTPSWFSPNWASPHSGAFSFLSPSAGVGRVQSLPLQNVGNQTLSRQNAMASPRQESHFIVTPDTAFRSLAFPNSPLYSGRSQRPRRASTSLTFTLPVHPPLSVENIYSVASRVLDTNTPSSKIDQLRRCLVEGLKPPARPNSARPMSVSAREPVNTTSSSPESMPCRRVIFPCPKFQSRCMSRRNFCFSCFFLLFGFDC